MLKVVIVEDEDVITQGLVCTVDWQEHGRLRRRRAAEQQSGASGVVREQQPDVVLTDIRMPRISGLAMAEARGSRAVAPPSSS